MNILDELPIWIALLLTAGFCVLLFEIGFRFGNRLHRRNPDAEVGGATGGVTAGLSFFILGILNSAVGRRNLIPVILFALVVAAVLALIMDLDKAQQGLLNVVQGPLLDLKRQLGPPGS